VDAIISLGHGFQVALIWSNLYYCFIGVLFGTMVGVLPGIGPMAGITLLLPATFELQPVSAVIMLAGIYYGAMYGGSTTAILMNIPGEAASVVTCIDGHEMARKGRAGAALFISAWGSFVGANLSICGIVFFAPIVARLAMGFGPPEMFMLMVLALLMVSYLGRQSILKTICMAVLGLFIGTIGMDIMTGDFRMTYGINVLKDGVGFVPVAMGLFGLGEILSSWGDPDVREVRKIRLRELIPSRDELNRSWGPVGRGSLIGFLMGLLPGSAHIVSSFASYALEKKLANKPEEFGTGRIEGVAGPETANNAASTSAMIPFLSLGIPSGPATAVMMVALLIHGIQPGPLLIVKHPDIFWGVVASMYIGNVMLIILNLPLVGLFINITRIPSRMLSPMILTICLVGTYSVAASAGDLWILLISGVAGYIFKRMEFDPAPLLLALILGPMMELALRQSLIMSDGSLNIFLQSKICIALLCVTGLVVLSGLASLLRRKHHGSALGYSK
jgi:putative tricarboxylic transport membrane protein